MGGVLVVLIAVVFAEISVVIMKSSWFCWINAWIHIYKAKLQLIKVILTEP